jgi:hypothetical protein
MAGAPRGSFPEILMRASLRNLFLALACASAPLSAQCIPLAGTGCPGGAPFVCNGGPPRLGQPWAATWTIPNSLLVYAAVMTNGPAQGVPGACVVGCSLIGIPMFGNVGWPTASVGGVIPNNAAFVGASIYVQGASLHLTPGGYCIMVHQGAVGFVTR